MNKRNPLIYRRTQIVGVLSDGIWTAHSRGIGANDVPSTTTINFNQTGTRP